MVLDYHGSSLPSASPIFLAVELDLVRTPVYVLCAAGLALLAGGNVELAAAAAFVGLAIALTPRPSSLRSALLVVLWAGILAQLTDAFSWPFDWPLRFMFAATLIGAVLFYTRWRLDDM